MIPRPNASSALRIGFGLVCAAPLLACLKPNPAFDPDRDSAEVGTDTGDVSGPLPTSTGTDDSGRTEGTATGSSGPATPTGDTTSTGDPSGDLCQAIGEPCSVGDCCQGCGACITGACATDDSRCGPCGACEGDGECTPRSPGAACQLARDPCADKVWGLEGGTCHANAAAAGVCDAGGECTPGPACAQGVAIVACDAVCIVDPGQCSEGMPVEAVDGTLLCAQDEPTPTCQSGCESDDPVDVAHVTLCMAGKCTTTAEKACGNYECNGDTCGESCRSSAECKPQHDCDKDVCT